MCASDAAIPIKSFSPELIVIPTLPSEATGTRASAASPSTSASTSARQLLEAIGKARPSAVVFGPGLGRSSACMAAVSLAMAALHPSRLKSGIMPRELGIDAPGAAPGDSSTLGTSSSTDAVCSPLERAVPLIVDADALWVVTRIPATVAGNRLAVLTPNTVEAARLWEAVVGTGSEEASGSASEAARSATSGGDGSSIARVQAATAAEELSRAMGGVTVVLKQSIDRIAQALPDDVTKAVCDEVGMPRRCGGQGDVLAGVIATFVGWQHAANGTHASGPVAAARAGCVLTKRAAARAFAKRRRATLTTDIIEELGAALEELEAAGTE